MTGPHSTPFYNDSGSDTETTPGDGDALLHSKNDSKHFLNIKEELEDNSFFKSNNNLPLHPFTGNLKTYLPNYQQILTVHSTSYSLRF